MSSTTDKIKGTANQAAGSVKQSIVRVTGNTRLQAEGHAQEAKGSTQKAVGSAKQGVMNLADKVRSSL